MVKTKIAALLALPLLLASCSRGLEFKWQKFYVDGHRTGVGVPTADNPEKALGVVENGVYKAPNGKVFNSGATPKVASLLIGVQPQMARLKEVVAYAPEAMVRQRPECALFNFVADRLAADVQEAVGRRVDVGITNTGGIRVDLPAGDILLDEVVSMLPFKNYLTYLELKGSDLRAAFEYMASTRPQCVSGARLVIKGGKLISAEVGGKPLDDSAVYGVGTIDFLLDGGDGFKLARNARKMIITDKKIGDVILRDIRKLTAEGKPLQYHVDGRITVEE